MAAGGRSEAPTGYLWEGAYRIASQLPLVELHLHLDGRHARHPPSDAARAPGDAAPVRRLLLLAGRTLDLSCNGERKPRPPRTWPGQSHPARRAASPAG